MAWNYMCLIIEINLKEFLIEQKLHSEREAWAIDPKYWTFLQNILGLFLLEHVH